MLVEVKFTLDVVPKAWASVPTADDQVRVEAARHAEAVVRDLYFDAGWIAEHHPSDHPLRRACTWCTPPPRSLAPIPPPPPKPDKNLRLIGQGDD